MSKTIWKYKLPRDGETIEIHECIIQVLHIAAQDGVPTLWAIVDPDLPSNGYTEVVAWGTGWLLPDDVYQECKYWGSCGDAYGYIWHYFAATRSSGRAYQDALPSWQTYSDCTKAAPYCETITISCDGSDGVNVLSCDKLAYNPSMTTACTGTISSNAYSNNVKIDFDKLVDMIEKCVESSDAATIASVR